MNTTTDLPPAIRRKHWRSVILWSLLIFLVGYPLSTGPVIRLSHELKINADPLFDVVYAPLGFLSKHCEPVDQFFHWYVRDIWGRL